VDKAAMDGGSLRLALVGDCMLGRLVNDALKTELPEYAWGDTLPLLLGADCRVCNLECVISDRGTPWSAYPKPFHFRSAAKNIAVLQAAGINAVSLANNHVLDYGYEALEEMLDILSRNGIAWSGAGRNFAEASKVAIVDIGGRKLGFLAFTDNEPDWQATSKLAGVFYVPIDLGDSRVMMLLDIVRGHKDTVDFLVVSAHWGPNWGYAPPREHVALAHALIDAGADLVYGHSCHVFRGIEFYRGQPILYGAGNFVDDYAVDEIERNDESFVYMVEIEKRITRGLRLYPTLIHNFQARRASGAEGRRISEKMQRLCCAFHTPAAWSEEEGHLAVGYARQLADSHNSMP
jgi:poly-gamma-glutamate capsule biosynthesis protein CapA/YwtB (metallophosphatase superfamily)